MNEETLFDLVLQAAVADRENLLNRHCTGNPQLRLRVEQLIQAHMAQQSAAIDPTEVQQVMADDSSAEQVPPNSATSAYEVGTVLADKYSLRELIAEGGMGAVWLASQAQPVKRKVAVKLIKAGMDSQQVIARFEAERQALAMMDHPNIARVFDGGMTEQGRPFFVMEYVKGIPITDYCDQARLAVRDRLELFVPVCQAIQHAHQKGIVHRDLKPSNILVCLYDGNPVVKVIDFGLAKAMHQPLTEHSIYTSHGVMVGTPLYMSPEQAEYNNLDVDTRTDIYSLGVILYELLTGTTPLEREQLRTAAYNEVLRLIKEVEPPKPSTRLSQSVSLPSIAAQRNIEPRHLSKSLSGDLDWIVMKSLEKERSRRYESAVGLARDVERFLNEEAIEARPPSSSYRIGKYLKKHKLQAMAFVLVLFAMVAGTTAATWGWLTALEAGRQVRESLQQVSAERDAKVTALAAEAEQREIAELALISGLLRPIGFGTAAETKSLLDWQRLPNDELKVRVLEEALSSPETAERVAKSLRRVAQAVVGLSASRRQQAIAALERCLSTTKSPSIPLLLLLELGDFSEAVVSEAETVIQRQSDFYTEIADQLQQQRRRLTGSHAFRLCTLAVDSAVPKASYDFYGAFFDNLCPQLEADDRLLLSKALMQIIDSPDTKMETFRYALERLDSLQAAGSFTGADGNARVVARLMGFVDTPDLPTEDLQYVVERLNLLGITMSPGQFERLWDQCEHRAKAGMVRDEQSTLDASEAFDQSEPSPPDLTLISQLMPHVSQSHVFRVWEYVTQAPDCKNFNNITPQDILLELTPRLLDEDIQQAWGMVCSASVLRTPHEKAWDAYYAGYGVDVTPEEPYTESFKEVFELLAKRMPDHQREKKWAEAKVISEDESLDYKQLRNDVLDALPEFINEETEETHQQLFTEEFNYFLEEFLKAGEYPDWNEEFATRATKIPSPVVDQAYDRIKERLNDIYDDWGGYSTSLWDYSNNDPFPGILTLQRIMLHMTEAGYKKAWSELRTELASRGDCTEQEFYDRIWQLLVLAPRMNKQEVSPVWDDFSTLFLAHGPALPAEQHVAEICGVLFKEMPREQLTQIHRDLTRMVRAEPSESTELLYQQARAFFLMNILQVHMPEADYASLIECLVQLEKSDVLSQSYYFDVALNDLDATVRGMSSDQLLGLWREYELDFARDQDLQEVGIAIARRIPERIRGRFIRGWTDTAVRTTRDQKLPLLLHLGEQPDYLLSKLLHPTTRASACDLLLQRLEEIYLYDGQHIFLTWPATDGKAAEATAAPGSLQAAKPTRQFLVPSDVALWLEQHQPDLDVDAILEADGNEAVNVVTE